MVQTKRKGFKMKYKTKNNIDTEISFDDGLQSEFGIHDGFFNALVIIDKKDYYFQCCTTNDKVDFNDCGHTEGLCMDQNEELAEIVNIDSSDTVLELLKVAYEQYISE